MTEQGTSSLVSVIVTTELGAVYHFPDMQRAHVEALLKSPNLHGFAQVTFVNQSAACLVIPARIIRTIAVDGEIKWRCPA